MPDDTLVDQTKIDQANAYKTELIETFWVNPESLAPSVVQEIESVLSDLELEELYAIRQTLRARIVMKMKCCLSHLSQVSDAAQDQAQSPEQSHEPNVPSSDIPNKPQEGLECTGCLTPWCKTCAELERQAKTEAAPAAPNVELATWTEDLESRMTLTLTRRSPLPTRADWEPDVERWQVEARSPLDQSEVERVTKKDPVDWHKLKPLPVFNVNQFREELTASFEAAGLDPEIWDQFTSNGPGFVPSFQLSSEEERLQDEYWSAKLRIKDNPSLLIPPSCRNWHYPRSHFQPLPWYLSYLTEVNRGFEPPIKFFTDLGISLKKPTWFYRQVKAPLEQEDLHPDFRQGEDNDVFQTPDCRPLPDPRKSWTRLLRKIPNVQRELNKENLSNLLQCECPRCVTKCAVIFAKHGLALRAWVDSSVGSIDYIRERFLSLVLSKSQQDLLESRPSQDWIIFATTSMKNPSEDSILSVDFNHLRENLNDRYFLRLRDDPGLCGLKNSNCEACPERN